MNLNKVNGIFGWLIRGKPGLLEKEREKRDSRDLNVLNLS